MGRRDLLDAEVRLHHRLTGDLQEIQGDQFGARVRTDPNR